MTHAQIRARERYGLTVKQEDFDAIKEQVEIGRAVKLGKRGLRTSIYLVTVQERDAVVVYNRRAKWVITFLPLEWNKNRKGRC